MKLTEILGGIKQRTGKITRKDAIELGKKSDTLINFCRNNNKLQKIMSSTFEDPKLVHLFHSSNIIKNLGQPLVTMPQYESSPGLWVFDDEPTGIVFLIWSDGHHKNPWKGTKYEAIVNPSQVKVLDEAFQRLIDYLSSKA